MKTFLLWLLIQTVFARFLIGMVLYTWKDLGLPADTLGMFLIPATVVIFIETIVSGVVVFPLVTASVK